MTKVLALVAHDNMKRDLAEWVDWNSRNLSRHHLLIFFWDPMSAQPHDVDVKALLRLATLYNVPTAINRSSADFLISSPLFEDEDYEPVVKDYKAYVERVLK